MKFGGCVYIVCNKNKTVVYVGITSDLRRRIYEHRNHLHKNSHTDRYNIEYLVYYECFSRIEEAISRETEIKQWRREKKDELINKLNPEWKDLWDEINNY